MSKETSLLVLESQAMFDAFGVDRSQPANKWTGEDSLDETLASGTIDYDEQQVAAQGKGAASMSRSDKSKDAKKAPRDAFGDDADLGAANPGRAFGGPAPAPEPVATRPAPARKPATAASVEAREEEAPAMNRNRAGMIAMRRSWVRVPSVGLFDAVSPNIRKAVDSAESALAASPDSREKHRSLVQALSYAGEIEKARDVAGRWLERDKLDPQALGVQADLLGRSGQRDLALRTLSGLVDVDPDRVVLHERMIKAYENAGRMVQACSHRIAISAIQRKDAKAAGAAMRCLRGVGRDKDAELVVGGLDTDEERTAAEKAATVAPVTTPARGDVVINARWDNGADLDLAIIAPDGSRTSFMGGATVEDSTSSARETLAMRSIRKGNYLVEVTRNGAASGSVRGSLDITVLGAKKTIPFEMVGSRTTVGRINIGLEQRLDRIWMDGVNCWLINPNSGARSKTHCPRN
jgi:tetratricopeptide (TPR) repeat protein